jgi:antitoxin component YwqK of YwqJK toxin-antitoxin module
MGSRFYRKKTKETVINALTGSTNEETRVNDILHGFTKHWFHKNSAKMGMFVLTPFVDGRKHGVCVYHNDDGTIFAQIVWNHGCLVKKYHFRNTHHAKIYCIEEYADGYMTRALYYHRNGRLKSETNYALRPGTTKTFLHGISRHCDKKGHLIAELIYIGGNLIE